MSVEDLTRHPEGKWSVAEILEHLYLSYTGTVKGFERCMEAGKPLATSPSLGQRAKALYVVGIGKFPPGRKAPKNTQPKGIPFEKIVADIGPQIVAWTKQLPSVRNATGRESSFSTIRFWARSPRGNGGSFIGCMDGTM